MLKKTGTNPIMPGIQCSQMKLFSYTNHQKNINVMAQTLSIKVNKCYFGK